MAMKNTKETPMKTGMANGRTQAYWIMTTPVQTVEMTNSLREVAGLFNEKNISAAAVLDHHQKPVGVITKTDLVRYEQERDECEILNEKPGAEENMISRSGFHLVDDPETVEHWMTPVIFSVKPETPMEEIARRMVKYGIHHIFVKGKNGEPLAGIVSSFDILKQIAWPKINPHE